MATGAIGASSIDVNAIVSSLMQLERRPLQALSTKEAQITNRLAAFSRVQGAVSSLQGAASTLANSASFTGLRAGTTGDGASAAVSDTATASAGTYALKVTQLAASQALASGVIASSNTLVGSGTLTITRGTTSGNTFTAGSSTPVSVTVTGTDTLATLRDKLNTAFAADGSGLSAAIVNDGTGVRLTLLGKATGVANTFKVDVTDNDGVNGDATGLSQFAFDPAVVPTPPATTAAGRNLIQTRAGSDAQFEVNGLALSASSNKVTGVITGVTLDLKKASADAVTTINVERDTAAMKAGVDAFIKAYNELDKVIREVTAFDAANRRAAVLTGESTVRAIQSQLRALVGAPMTAAQSGDFTVLSEIGIEMQRDGTLSLNATKFNTAAADPAKLARLFTTTSDTSDAARGFGVRLKNFSDAMVGTDGLLPARAKGLQAQVTALGKEQTRINSQLELTEQRLRKQYSALDVQLQRMQGQSNSLANALSQLPGANSSGQ